MAPDIPKIDPDRHPNLGDAAWNFRDDEVLRWLFHGNSLSDLRDLLIPFSDKCLMQLSVNGVYSSSGSVVFSGEFGTTASDLCQHVDQHFEIGGLYTFKQSMSLFVNWTLDDREQLLA